ncbi:TetR/AcrR family transcriptional regulator [Aeromicrobium sp. CF4.19]|uniref:TetR/AcrR family transcriptional regulator n=1 Tax=Aeromicrobium sp. CF4.19 TaxID=3373082 RepID=UPI003EE474FC
MPRQTREESDAEIVDRASALFARHGYRHTSLQQVADAVGYSKAGLLHRFTSKEAIYLAAVRTAAESTLALVADVSSIVEGTERDRVIIAALVDATYERPGTWAFLHAVFSDEDSDDTAAELRQAGEALAGLLGIDSGSAADARRVRLLVAATGAHHAALTAAARDRTREWRPHIIDAAMDALGHRSDRSTETGS